DPWRQVFQPADSAPAGYKPAATAQVVGVYRRRTATYSSLIRSRGPERLRPLGVPGHGTAGRSSQLPVPVVAAALGGGVDARRGARSPPPRPPPPPQNHRARRPRPGGPRAGGAPGGGPGRAAGAGAPGPAAFTALPRPPPAPPRRKGDASELGKVLLHAARL